MVLEDGPINVGRAIFAGLELSAKQALATNVTLHGYYDTQSAYPVGGYSPR